MMLIIAVVAVVIAAGAYVFYRIRKMKQSREKVESQLQESETKFNMLLEEYRKVMTKDQEVNKVESSPEPPAPAPEPAPSAAPAPAPVPAPAPEPVSAPEPSSEPSETDSLLDSK